MQRQIAGIFLLLLLLVSCTPHFDPKTVHSDQEKLYTLLMRTHSHIDPAEARTISHEAIHYSRELASRYHVSTPPLVHNFLTNVGIKNRGLCYQWSDDLYLHLQKFHFKTISLQPVGAHVGSYWLEHNALVALPRHTKNLASGILLDPWRASGKLYFAPILKDPKYQWKIRTDRCDIYQSGK